MLIIWPSTHCSNTDFIVKFPDWDPSNTSSPLPQSHLWYSTQKVINALGLLIDAGNNFAGSVTFPSSFSLILLEMHLLFLKPCMRNILVRRIGKRISIILKQAAGGYCTLTSEGQWIALAISKALYENILCYILGGFFIRSNMKKR